MPTNFAVDEFSNTAWTSGTGDTPVSFVIGLVSSITLSKVLVEFQSSLPYQNATLQLFNANLSQWMDVQYFAVNCSNSFGMNAATQ